MSRNENVQWFVNVATSAFTFATNFVPLAANYRNRRKKFISLSSKEKAANIKKIRGGYYF